MEKAVCYCVTRNLYHDLIPSVRSVLDNTLVDRVYIIAEDNDIGYKLSNRVEILNMGRQIYFHPDGPNYNKKWTYMALMKTAMAKIFPQLPQILTLDHDTIILDDLQELWLLWMNDYYVAGCNEPYWERITGKKYINAGVLMWNLDKIRKDKLDDEMILALNNDDLRLPEQEVINTVLESGIKIIDSAYNFCDYVDPPTEPIRILHFAGKAGRESWMRKEIWGSGI